MRVLLIKPKARLGSVLGLQAFQRMKPLELGYLAAAAGPEHDTRILDLRLTAWPELALLDGLRRFRPNLVGITGYSHDATSGTPAITAASGPARSCRAGIPCFRAWRWSAPRGAAP